MISPLGDAVGMETVGPGDNGTGTRAPRRRTWIGVLVLGAIVFGVLVAAAYALDEYKFEQSMERLENQQRGERRERLAQEYEERTRGPCGRHIEMINRDGDSGYWCERDVPLKKFDGWIVRRPDEPTPAVGSNAGDPVPMHCTVEFGGKKSICWNTAKKCENFASLLSAPDKTATCVEQLDVFCAGKVCYGSMDACTETHAGCEALDLRLTITMSGADG